MILSLSFGEQRCFQIIRYELLHLAGGQTFYTCFAQTSVSLAVHTKVCRCDSTFPPRLKIIPFPKICEEQSTRRPRLAGVGGWNQSSPSTRHPSRGSLKSGPHPHAAAHHAASDGLWNKYLTGRRYHTMQREPQSVQLFTAASPLPPADTEPV